MPVVSIRHTTTYRYRRPVGFGEHRMLLRPLESFDQRLLSAELRISPEPSRLEAQHDLTGACVEVARFERRAAELVVESRVRIDHRPGLRLELETGGLRAAGGAEVYAPDEAEELEGSIRRRFPDGGEVARWAGGFRPRTGVLPASAAMIAMMEDIHGGFAYALRLRGPPQSPQETLAARRGSCRDFALLMMEGARSLGLAARFVTGYVYCATPKDRTGGGHTHAWARVFLPGCGWVDFDPTNAIVGNQDLIRVAVAADPRHVTPLHGSFAGAQEDFLGMDVDVELALEPQRMQRLRVAASR